MAGIPNEKRSLSLEKVEREITKARAPLSDFEIKTSALLKFLEA